MQFFKDDYIYIVIRVTGAQDNILGITFCFVETNISETDIEVIEFDFPNISTNRIRTSKDTILKQVLSGLEYSNKVLETNYKLSKIYFSPFDLEYNQIYFFLVLTLIAKLSQKKWIQIK